MLLWPLYRGSPCARKDPRRTKWCSSFRRGREREHLWSGMRLSPFLLLFPPPRALTLGEVGCKVSESGVGSCKRSRGRGASAGRRGQKRSSRRLCSAPGERPGEESPGEYGDCQPRHSGRSRGSSLLPPLPLPQASPTPNPTPDTGPKFPRLPLPHPFTPKLHQPRGPKTGIGKEKRVAAKVRDGTDTSWRVDVGFGIFNFFFCPRNCFPLRAPILSHFPHLSALLLNSSEI